MWWHSNFLRGLINISIIQINQCFTWLMVLTVSLTSCYLNCCWWIRAKSVLCLCWVLTCQSCLLKDGSWLVGLCWGLKRAPLWVCWDSVNSLRCVLPVNSQNERSRFCVMIRRCDARDDWTTAWELNFWKAEKGMYSHHRPAQFTIVLLNASD